LTDGGVRTGSYWGGTVNTGGWTDNYGIFVNSNNHANLPQSGIVDYTRFFYGASSTSSLSLTKGGTYLFGVKCGIARDWTISWMPPAKIVFADGSVFTSSSVGQVVGDYELISWIYDSDTFTLLFEIKALEDRFLTYFDFYSSWYTTATFNFSNVPSYTSSAGIKFHMLFSGFWTVSSNVPSDGGVSESIQNQTQVIIGSIDNSVQTVTTAITNQTTTITNQISDSTSILKGAVEQAGQQISDKVGQAASDITGKVDETGQAIQDKIDEQYDISDASQVGEAAQGFADQAAESLGVVSYVDTLFSGLSGLVTAGSTTLTFPALAFSVEGTEYQFWEEYTFDLAQLDGWFAGLMAAVRLATSTVVVGAVIHYLQSVYKDVIG